MSLVDNKTRLSLKRELKIKHKERKNYLNKMKNMERNPIINNNQIKVLILTLKMLRVC